MNSVRIKWLARYPQFPWQLPDLKHEYGLDVEFTTARAYLEAVYGKRRAIEGKFAQVAEKLVELNVLTAEEVRELEPDVNVKVRDSRADKSERLPDVR